MPRREMSFATGEHYHLYNRGVDRQLIFFSQDNRLFFLKQLRKHLCPKADVLAYCLMPNHYHLLIKVADEGVSEAMQAFTTSYVKAVNRDQGRVGPLFQSRFEAVHVDREEYLLHLSRYIHRNPVEAGLVESPDQWEFSSYREYVGLRSGTLPKMDWIKTRFANCEDYRVFVERGYVLPQDLAQYTID
jgi:putative transposase